MNAPTDNDLTRGAAADADPAPGRWSSRRRRVTIVAATAVVAGIAVALWAIGASRGGDTKHAAAAGGMDGAAGMDMPAGESVRLTSAQLRQFGVTFGTAEVRPLTSEVRAAGAVTFDETRIAQVSPKFGGFIERLHVDFTGQPVRRGQALLEVYSPELVVAQQELLLAAELQRNLGTSAVPGVPDGSTNLVEAARRRLRLWDISDAQIEEVLRSGRARRTLTLFAPVAGVVVEKKVVRGQAVQSGEQLYTIADLSEVWVDIQLREADAAAVRVGSGADVELTGLPGRAFKGRVEYVYPVLDPETRAVRARVAVTNTGGAVKPGMYATVRVTTPGRSALTVPTSAVLRTGERNLVFVDMGAGEFMPHDVELGRVAGEYSEVLSGVERGHRVVTSAQFLLDSESNLGEVMKAMMGQMGSGDMQNMEGMRDTPGTQMPGMDMNEKGADMKNMPGMTPPSAATPPRR